MENITAENNVSPEIQTNANIINNGKKSYFISTLILTAIALSSLAFLVLNKNQSVKILTAAGVMPTIPAVSPTPIPFVELTIPYLRERKYESALGEMQNSYAGANYTAYLTNYTSDGLNINGLLTRPTTEMPVGGFPAIVFVHGYIPPTQYQTTQQYYDYVDYLARNGFVVFKIDLRGHGASEGTPGGAYYSSDYIIDTLNAYAALASSDFVNPQKIGLWGHSMAGNVTMRAFAAKPEIPAVVIWAGAVYTYTDREKYGINDSSYVPPRNITMRQSARQKLIDTYGQFDAQSPFWSQFIPTNYLDELKGAIQINHAVNDDVVDVGYSRDMTALLDKTTIPHELHEYDGGGHNIAGPSFGAAMENTVAFYKKYLGVE